MAIERAGALPGVLQPVRPAILSTRLIPKVTPELAAGYGFDGERTPSAALITCDQDDALYTALDEATKQAPVEVVYARSLYAGSRHAPGPLSGEILGVLAAQEPEEALAGLRACIRCLEDDACFYTADAAGELLIFPHVIASLGRYLSKEAGLEPGVAMAYLIAPPLEALYGVDAALKAAEVRVARTFPPPTETNFSGAYLTGPLEECEAAAAAFASAIVDIAARPRLI